MVYPYSSVPFDYVDPAAPAQAPHPASFPAFQMPSYLYSTTPALASGGGAEILPASMLNEADWLANNGYSAKNKEKQTAAYHDPSSSSSYDHQPRQTHSPSGPFNFDEFIAPVPVSSSSPANFLSSFDESTGSNATHAVEEEQQQQQQQHHKELIPTTNSALGLPVYSATGFDVLNILSRVFHRPHPRVQLGPVDCTCSFVVVDTRRYDHPVVYCSPNFCSLTGYDAHEVLGRNCRFLQSPGGQLEPSGQRPDSAAQSAASYLKKNLSVDKECQTVVTNYRKDGSSFTNLVTVIPIGGGVSGEAHEENDVVFHVGFQIDLMEQPKAILENMKAGNYTTDHATAAHVQRPSVSSSSSSSGAHGNNAALISRERKSASIPPVLVSKEMKKLIANPSFFRSISITTKANANVATGPGTSSSDSSSSSLDSVFGGNHPLHMMLLEAGPDFVHVVSLKGSFLYVAPSVRRVLGYEPEDLVGATIADLAHPEDVVPLMRELKESSNVLPLSGGSGAPPGGSGPGPAPGGTSASASASSSQTLQSQPRTVDLLFRARTKNGVYVWVESRGRLHVEPGKGKKAIILTGRAREMSNITWETISLGGGLAEVVTVEVPVGNNGEVELVVRQQEFWGTISRSRVLMMVGSGIKDVLGWAPEDFMGRSVSALLMESSGVLEARIDEVGREGTSSEAAWTTATCMMKTKDGSGARVVVNIFRTTRDPAVRNATAIPGGISPAHLMYQVRLAAAETFSLIPPAGSVPSAAFPGLSSNVFEALDIKRGSSWQYELQQLKFGNKKLAEEIVMLETAIRASKAKKAKAASAESASGSGSSSGGSQEVQQYAPQISAMQQHYHQQQQQSYPHPYEHPAYNFGHQVAGSSSFNSQAPLPPFNLRLPTAALPMRASAGQVEAHHHHQHQHYHHQDPLQRSRHPPYTSFGSQRTYKVANDYLGTSPYIQRVQDDVAQAAAAAGGGGYYSAGAGSRTSLKRAWGEMDGHR